jgi:hypothetical protein
MFYCSYCRMRYDDPDGHKHCAARRMGGEDMSYGWAKDADTHAHEELDQIVIDHTAGPDRLVITITVPDKDQMEAVCKIVLPALHEAGETLCRMQGITRWGQPLSPSTVRDLPEEG